MNYEFGEKKQTNRKDGQMNKEEVKEIVEAAVGACMQHVSVPVLMTPEEVAQKLGVSKDTIRAWLKSGELAAYELGARMTRIAVRDVNAMLDRIRSASATEEEGTEEEKKEDESEKSGGAAEEAAENHAAEAAADVVGTDAAGGCDVEAVPEDPDPAGTDVGTPGEPEKRPEDGEADKPSGGSVPEAGTDREGDGVTEAGFEQCEQRHPVTGVRCCLAKGHEGKHKCRVADAEQ